MPDKFTHEINLIQGKPDAETLSGLAEKLDTIKNDTNISNKNIINIQKKLTQLKESLIHLPNLVKTGSLPSGLIVSWYGLLADIPAGWILCNGSNGTPNLNNRLIIGAGNTYNIDDTGGATQHRHGANSSSGGCTANSTCCYRFSNYSYTDYQTNLPPYYQIIFIMKT